MRLFNNHTSGGGLLDGYNDITSQWWPDAAEEADDAFIRALI